MNIKSLNGVTNIFNKISFSFKKYSPEILMGCGIIGTITGTVLACKATTKIDKIIKNNKETIKKIHETLKDETISNDVYSEEDAKKDIRIVYTKTALEFVKLYAPSTIIILASISSMIASNGILKKRNAALAMAYMAIDKTFKEYRNRVIDQFGEKVDKQLKYGIKSEEIEETSVDEDGKEISKKKTIETVNPYNLSDYSRIFDESNPYWQKDAEYNFMFLKGQQAFANKVLEAQGYLFLNDVYKMIGFPTSKAGQVVGWIKDSKNGDNVVDFGIFDVYNKKARDFINGYERSFILDFNVDGYILNDVKELEDI